VAPGDSIEELAIAFVAVVILALAALAVVVQPSLSFWQSDES
jgi:heme/copper-type cytochrome/quinol oxidase subunit 4